MKIDKFTKVTLAIIAVNLSLLTIKSYEWIPTVYASEPNQMENPNPKIQYRLLPLNEDGSMNVKIVSADELDVNITGVNTYDELEVELVGIETEDELNVNIDEIGGGYVPHSGPIRVEVE